MIATARESLLEASQRLGPEEHVDEDQRERKSFGVKLLATIGPGLMVCFADTDGSCLLTAADSGSLWRYRLLLLQLILIPILYFAQELTVRLGLLKGKGLTALLREKAGPRWGWAVAVPLLLDAFLALISEVNVFAQTIHVCWDVPQFLTSTAFTLCLVALVFTGSYHVAEKVGLVLGSLQVLFFVTMVMSKPRGGQIWKDFSDFPFNEDGYVKLITANIGAVIMPWMLAYQQSAVCEKGLALPAHAKEHLLLERIDTAVGSFLTQGVMAAMLITVAASPKFSGQDVDDVGKLLEIFTEVVGRKTWAKVLLTFAICGACTVAAIVVTLCGSWALEGAMGGEPVSNSCGIVEHVRARPTFFVAYSLTCLVVWLLIAIAPDFADTLTGVWTQFVNGLLMPPVIFSLWFLASTALPPEHRLKGWFKWFLFVLFGICALFCFASIPLAIVDAVADN